MTEYERIRKEIAELIYEPGSVYDIADQILAIDGIEIRSKDQTIVIPCYQDGDMEKCTYINAEPPSWIKEAGLIKVIPKGR